MNYLLHGFGFFPFEFSVRMSGFKFDADESKVNFKKSIFNFRNFLQHWPLHNSSQGLADCPARLRTWNHRGVFKICIIFYWPIKTVGSLVNTRDHSCLAGARARPTSSDFHRKRVPSEHWWKISATAQSALYSGRLDSVVQLIFPWTGLLVPKALCLKKFLGTLNQSTE